MATTPTKSSDTLPDADVWLVLRDSIRTFSAGCSSTIKPSVLAVAYVAEICELAANSGLPRSMTRAFVIGALEKALELYPDVDLVPPVSPKAS